MSLEERVSRLEYIMREIARLWSEPAEEPAKPQTESTSILEQFPPNYRNYLTLKDGKIYCKYVSKDTWTEINQVAMGLGYEYVGGKGSHWRKK